jgi:hypothetical protein
MKLNKRIRAHCYEDPRDLAMVEYFQLMRIGDALNDRRLNKFRINAQNLRAL